MGKTGLRSKIGDTKMCQPVENLQNTNTELHRNHPVIITKPNARIKKKQDLQSASKSL